MGDTYFIGKINCAYCGKKNDFSNDDGDEFSFYPGTAYNSEYGGDFICKFCKKKNIIIREFKAIKNKKNKKFISI